MQIMIQLEIGLKSVGCDFDDSFKFKKKVEVKAGYEQLEESYKSESVS